MAGGKKPPSRTTGKAVKGATPRSPYTNPAKGDGSTKRGSGGLKRAR